MTTDDDAARRDLKGRSRRPRVDASRVERGLHAVVPHLRRGAAAGSLDPVAAGTPVAAAPGGRAAARAGEPALPGREAGA